MKSCGLALRFASEALRSDPEVILAAVKRDPASIQYATAAGLAAPGVALAGRSRPKPSYKEIFNYKPNPTPAEIRAGNEAKNHI